jgi:SAM-dependent methyltransferase
MQTTYSVKDYEYFNKYAKGYSPYTENDLHLLLEDLLIILKNKPLQWGCEIGSADGQFTEALARCLLNPVSFVGIDIAEKVLRRYPFYKLCGNAFQMPVANGVLDLVCYVASLHHLAPFSMALGELNRVLTPSGIAFFLEPNFFHPHRRFFMNYIKIYNIYRKTNDVPVNALKLRKILWSSGFDVITLRYVNINFKSPGLLQTIQNSISGFPWPKPFLPYVMPWFILIAKKRDVKSETHQ